MIVQKLIVSVKHLSKPLTVAMVNASYQWQNYFDMLSSENTYRFLNFKTNRWFLDNQNRSRATWLQYLYKVNIKPHTELLFSVGFTFVHYYRVDLPR